MPRKAKGLTRPITRKQARSYDRSHPNPGDRPRLGVTHLAELNGPGAYDEYHRRYEATRRLLENAEADQVAGYTAAQKSAMKKMTPARRAAFKRMLAASPDISTVRRRKKKATPNRKAAAKRKAPAKRKTKRKKRKLTKAERKKISLRNLRKAHKARGTKMKRGRQTRSYGKRKSKKTGRKTGGYKALRARYGPRSRWTYKYSTKKGQVRDIPDHALLGYPSASAMRQVYRTGSDRERAALSRKLQKLYERRERDADKAAARIRAGRGMFTPNEDVLSYQEWEEMRPNARRRRKKKTTKRRKMRRNAARKTSQARGSKGRFVSRKRKTTKRKTTKRKTTRRKATKRKATRVGKKPRYGTKAYYRWLGRKGAAARKRKGRKKTTTTKRRTASKRRTTKRKTTTRRRTGRAKSMTITMRANRRRRMRRNQGSYTTNRRRRSRRRTYRKNQGFMAELGGALKLGALVTAGFATHRALTHVVDVHLMSKVEALNTGTMGQYRGILSGFLTAALGIGATMAMPLKDAKAPIAAGMAASFIHGAIVTALNAAGASEAAAYFSNYPNAEGSMYGHAIGSYYEFSPHQVYAGTGSYYEIPSPVSGFGQSPLVTQAAAGYGQLRDNQLMQAAAGMGQLRDDQLMQAAAGMGQSPLLTQAAAGTGEYIAYGASAIGEYDEMPVSGVGMSVDEGIHPNLHSAEQALSVAEAAAGVGSAEVPLQSTVNPTMIADPISDLPGGSRAGVFQGGDGIFG